MQETATKKDLTNISYEQALAELNQKIDAFHAEIKKKMEEDTAMILAFLSEPEKKRPLATVKGAIKRRLTDLYINFLFGVAYSIGWVRRKIQHDA